ARNRMIPEMPRQEALPVDGKPPPEPPPEREWSPECAIVGYAIAHYRLPKPDENGNVEVRAIQPGDDIIVTTISGAKLAPVKARLAPGDYFKAEMSEYDSNYVFVPLAYLQKLRAMEDKVTSIQIRLKHESDTEAVVKRLDELFRQTLRVQTWKDKQGPL